MSIDELRELFFGKGQCDSYNKTKKPITKLKWILKQAEKEKIEFALSILEEIADDESDLDTVDLVWNKIQELRTYLDGNKD